MIFGVACPGLVTSDDQVRDRMACPKGCWRVRCGFGVGRRVDYQILVDRSSVRPSRFSAVPDDVRRRVLSDALTDDRRTSSERVLRATSDQLTGFSSRASSAISALLSHIYERSCNEFPLLASLGGHRGQSTHLGRQLRSRCGVPVAASLRPTARWLGGLLTPLAFGQAGIATSMRHPAGAHVRLGSAAAV